MGSLFEAPLVSYTPAFFQFELSFFEVNGRQHAVVRVLAFWVVEQLDVFEDIPPSFFACAVFPPSDLLPLQELKEALGHRVVVTIAPAAHRMFQIVFAQERGPFAAGKLRALI